MLQSETIMRRWLVFASSNEIVYFVQKGFILRASGKIPSISLSIL